jgi:hypothetical protein
MSEKEIFYRKTYFEDNKLVDFLAAMLTGSGLWWLNFRWMMPLLRSPIPDVEELTRLAVKAGSFIIAALLLFLWKRRIRAQWGWILIAILGMVITSGIDEMIYRATATDRERNFMPAFSPFPVEIIVWLGHALVLMGVAHYIGLLVMMGKRKYL